MNAASDRPRARRQDLAAATFDAPRYDASMGHLADAPDRVAGATVDRLLEHLPQLLGALAPLLAQTVN